MGLVEDVRGSLVRAGDPARAVTQQAYMKSEMPYRGITSPELKKLLRPLLKAWVPATRTEWESTVRELWDGATYREERYAALAVARHRSARGWLDPDSLSTWRYLIVSGAWWDVVDETATHLVGEVLTSHRGAVTPVLHGWASDEDLWVRRTAVICQVGDREQTDTVLLRHAVVSNVDDTTFWLRKAIGWALRDYARTDPDWVRAEVTRLGDRLSGLSRREAIKHLSA